MGCHIGAESTLQLLLSSSPILLKNVKERDVSAIVALATRAGDDRVRSQYLEFLAMLCCVDGRAVPAKQLLVLRLVFGVPGSGSESGARKLLGCLRVRAY